MSQPKYFQETHDEDGDRLWWPGGPEGFPFRGAQPPQTHQDEYENLKVGSKFRWRLFYLAKEKDGQDYAMIMDKCANGRFFMRDREKTWDEDTKGYRIYLEWYELAYDTPPDNQGGVKDAIHHHIQSQAGTVTAASKLAGLRKDW